jgi:hypothetical protein
MSSVGMLLIAAGVGYWVLTLAGKQKARIKTLGRWLGLLIIIVSVLGASCKMYYQWTCGSSGYYKKCSYSASNCPKSGKWGKGGQGSDYCPFTKSSTPPASK